MPATATGTSKRWGFRYYDGRNGLLSEMLARPSARLWTATLSARIATLSGEAGMARDFNHMVALCRRLGAPEPSPGARWCLLEAPGWRLRWERHTEVSTWTFYRPIPDDIMPKPEETALDLVPQDWLAELPGEAVVAAHVALLRGKPALRTMPADDEISVSVAGDDARVFTDFRAGPDGFTRYEVVQPEPDGAVAGRIVQQLFEIETYRLMALLAFPVAGEAQAALAKLEAKANAAAEQVSQEGGIEADRALLNQLAALAAEAQSIAGRTDFRFAAARAYYGLVRERIAQLREERIDGRPTIGEFMDRRLAPAMRTCEAVAERQTRVVEHISRTSQLLNTRVDVAAEITNASLLASMDRRANLQLQLQQTVEGLSVAAISYYAIGLLGYLFKAIKYPGFDANIAMGIATPIVVALVWWPLRAMRRSMIDEHKASSGGKH
jgi:uncharacterized membrane-anchored protein